MRRNSSVRRLWRAEKGMELGERTQEAIAMGGLVIPGRVVVVLVGLDPPRQGQLQGRQGGRPLRPTDVEALQTECDRLCLRSEWGQDGL